MEETRLIPGLGRSPEEGSGIPFQYSCLENPMKEEPGGLQSVGSQRVGHNWATSLCRVHHMKCWAAWITSRNQDCLEKFQLPQICRWYHPKGRASWRQRGELKSWLKTQYLKNLRSWHLGPSFLTNRCGKSRSSDRFYFLVLQNQWMMTTAMKLKDTCPLEEKLWQI